MSAAKPRVAMMGVVPDDVAIAALAGDPMAKEKARAYMEPADDLSADFAAMTDPPAPEAVPVPLPTDVWLRNRRFGFGASDCAVVLAALGWRDPADLPTYMRKRVKPKRVRGLTPTPRVWLEKAGIVAPLAIKDGPGTPVALGREREPELVRQWAEKIRRGLVGPGADHLDHRSVMYVERDWPRNVLPLVDRHAPRLTATPDVLVENAWGELECWDAKCSVRPYGELKPHHHVQLHAQMAVCAGEAGGILEGEAWAAAFRDHAGEPLGAIVSHGCERDEELIRELREASREGWARVEEARAAWEANQ